MIWLDPGLQPTRSNREPDPAAILDANEASPQSIGDHPDQGFRKHIIFFSAENYTDGCTEISFERFQFMDTSYHFLLRVKK